MVAAGYPVRGTIAGVSGMTANLFGTSGIRGPFGDDVDADLALRLGRGLGATDVDRVVIGRDPRTTGPLLVDAFSAGLQEMGVDVVRLGMAATPTVARSIAWQDADVGVVITASHNPPTDNGFKFWTPSGQAFDQELRDELITAFEADSQPASWDDVGSQTRWDGGERRHRELLAGEAGDLSGLSVVVDVGNGAGGVTADALVDAGADVVTLNGRPDGRFPGRPSEPDEESLESLRAHVAATDADLGIAHDGDADRMMVVDETGAFVPGDVLLALFATSVAGFGDRVAVPVDTSLAVADHLATVGASVMRTKVGDVYVAAATKQDDVVFGGEPSGAWIFPDETRCPDGPFAGIRLAWMAADEGSMRALTDEVETYPLERSSFEVTDKEAVMLAVEDAVREVYDRDAIDDIDGVRVNLEGGWFLVRASGTQPLVRITAEAREPDVADALLAEARELVHTAKNRSPD